MRLFRIHNYIEGELSYQGAWITVGYSNRYYRSLYIVDIALPIRIRDIFYDVPTRTTITDTRRVMIHMSWRGFFKSFTTEPYLLSGVYDANT